MNVIRRNNVRVQRTAEATAPTLIYGPGFGCSQEVWADVASRFVETHHQILFDYVGCGQSDVAAFTASRYSALPGYVEDLIEVCDASAATADLTFIGHSVSCSIGILASIARPHLFRRLVLLGPSPCYINASEEYRGGFEREDLDGLLELMDMNFIGWSTYFVPLITSHNISHPVSAQLADNFCSTDPLMARVFAQATFYADNRQDFEKVRTRCLVLQHEHDALAPMHVGQYVHDHLFDSTFEVLPVHGHCAHMSHPEMVAEAIRTFLGKAS